MPLLMNAVSRRALLGGAVASTVASLARGADQKQVRWALLSDTHLSADVNNAYRGFRPSENLRQVLPEVASWKPEGMLINGDLARLQGLAGDYERLKAMLAELKGLPAGFTLGNHDDRKHFFGTFGKPASGQPQPVKDKHVLVMELGGLRLVLLDSLYMVNEVPGLLGKGQREWLDEYLTASDGSPVLLFVHHTLDDADSSLLDSDRFLRIAAKHRKVKAVLYGHSHRYGYETVDGLHLVNLPAVGYNFADSEPVGWVQAVLSAEGADFTLRAIGGNKEGNGKTRSLAWRG